MKADKIVELILKLAPLLQKLLQRKQTPRSPEEQERIRQAAEEALLNRKVNVMSVSSPSPRLQVSRDDILKVLKGALIAGAGVALARIADAIPGLDLGPYGDVVAALLMIVINFVRKWLGGPA